MVAIVAVVHIALGYAFLDLGKSRSVEKPWSVTNIEVSLCGPVKPSDRLAPAPRLIEGGQIPALARALKLSGTVRLQAQINAKGEPISTCLERRGNDQLDAMMAGEVMTWRFAPPVREGAGLPSLYRAEFRLDP
jgi:TonB family protein